MKQGEIWLINLDSTVGAEIKKTRPAIIVNDNALGILPLKIIVPVTDSVLDEIKIGLTKVLSIWND